tara:strand:+ start:4745 stop:5932 length:1188 start_codon:yes stop_codon:yes gene_type:complete
MFEKDLRFLAGAKTIKSLPDILFSQLACDFLDELSKNLIKSKKAKIYQDIISFAFWCRKSNIDKLKNQFSDSNIRIGLGLIFHISPSNVPINFAYTFVFGLITGNSNVIRVSSKNFPQTVIICQEIKNLFNKKKYKNLKKKNLFIKYKHDDKITGYYSSICNARVIWGGNKTINDLRSVPIPPNAKEIVFSDKYSICIINSDKLNKLKNIDIKKIAEKFYNDTFLFDQNACSSPHLVLWLGKNHQTASKKFWEQLSSIAQSKYKLEASSNIDKIMKLRDDSAKLQNIKNIYKMNNYIYRVQLKKLSKNLHELRGKWGYFYEYCLKNLNVISKFINTNFQTITYYGVKKSDMVDFAKNNNLKGVDRIVPIGEALEIGLVWDGIDLRRSLSRIIDIN